MIVTELRLRLHARHESTPMLACQTARPGVRRGKLQGDRSAGKQPGWAKGGAAARTTPPFWVTSPRRQDTQHRVAADRAADIDIDIDDPVIASRCRRSLSSSSTRRCANPVSSWPSPTVPARCIGRRRANRGRSRLIGKLGKVEVLGKGQQFVVSGCIHLARRWNGRRWRWRGDARRSDPRSPRNEILAVLTSCAEAIGAEPPKKANGHDHAPGEAQADALRIGAALNEIPMMARQIGRPGTASAWPCGVPPVAVGRLGSMERSVGT